jgi:hypothetical protein
MKRLTNRYSNCRKKFNYEYPISISKFLNSLWPYLYPQHSCRTPVDLDLYLPMNKRELKNVDAKYETKVGY